WPSAILDMHCWSEHNPGGHRRRQGAPLLPAARATAHDGELGYRLNFCGKIGPICRSGRCLVLPTRRNCAAWGTGGNFPPTRFNSETTSRQWLVNFSLAKSAARRMLRATRRGATPKAAMPPLDRLSAGVVGYILSRLARDGRYELRAAILAGERSAYS